MTELEMRPATYEDLLKVPDNFVAELIEGELYTSPRPGSRHARTSSVLGAKLVNAFDSGDGGPGGWWIVDEPELHLSGNAVVPDLAGWRRERMPIYPDAAVFDIVPDWICEVQSVSTARVDRVKKLPVYLRHRVQHVWLINPVDRTLEVLRLENDRWFIAGNYGGDDVVRAEPFDAVEIELASLWIDPPAK